MARRQYLGIYDRTGELLRVAFSSPFGPELITFIDPSQEIELKLRLLTENTHVVLFWDYEGIKIKPL